MAKKTKTVVKKVEETVEDAAKAVEEAVAPEVAAEAEVEKAQKVAKEVEAAPKEESKPEAKKEDPEPKVKTWADKEDPFRRINPHGLYPPFLRKLHTLLKNCEARGAHYVAQQGLRTYEEQNALYEKGRSAPGKIVTNARGGQSYHNFGMACDFVRDMKAAKGVQPSWDPEDYRILAEEAEKLGLEAGLDWHTFKDPPHVQLHTTRAGIGLHQLRELYASNGILAVYHLLDKYRW